MGVAVKLGKSNTKIVVDAKFSLTSTNPVQNKVITKAIEELKAKISSIPDTDDFVTTEEVEVIVNEKIDNIDNVEAISIDAIRQLFK